MSRIPTIDAAASGFFVLRSPLLSVRVLLEHAEDHTGDAERDRPLLRERLAGFVERPEIREALFVASPRLVDRLEAWRRDPESRGGQATERALVRYLQRMTTRSTPFGLFSGYSIGRIGDATNLELPPLDAVVRATRIDMGYLFGLVDELGADPAVHQEVSYRPNPTRYEAAGRLHYVVRSSEEGARAHRLVAVDETDYLTATLERAEGGATAPELADGLVGPAVPAESARAYVDTLIRERMLVSDLELPVTGAPPLTLLIERLEDLKAAEPTRRVLAGVAARLAAIDRAGLGVPPERYLEVEQRLRSRARGATARTAFQVDMTRPAPGLSLDERVVQELLRGVERLRLLAAPQRDPLADLRKAFRARYEDQEVPFLEAFDDEAGIGLDALPPARGEGDHEKADLGGFGDLAVAGSWGPREQLLLNKLLEAADSGTAIALTDAEVLAVAPEPPPELPPAFAVMATLFGAAGEPDDEELELVVHGAFGPSGARLLGRFCAADEELRRCVEGHLRAEEAREPDAIFAEVAHLPQTRLGNVIHRPLLREFEIDYLGPSGAPASRRIELSDLRISLAGEQFVVRSDRLGRRVIPRVSSAISFSLSVPPLFRLFGLLQHQAGPDGISFDWGPLGAAARLPRVRVGRSTVALASWRVEPNEIERLCSAPAETSFREVQQWREARRLPRLARLAGAAGSVTVDFDNVLSVDSFLKLLAGRTTAFLTELYPPPEQLAVRSPEGPYVHEVLVPFVLGAPVARRAGASLPARRLISGRRFAPGSEWLYVKLYGGRAAADALLRHEIEPLCEELTSRGDIDRWFFVRYGDPDPHLRLRLHGEPEVLHRSALPAVEQLAARALESGRLWRIQLDTYEREVERYGGREGIELAERLFHADSVAVARALRALPPGDDRLGLALLGVDGLFDAFGLSLEERAHAVARMRDGLAGRAKPGGISEAELSREFRTRRATLPQLDGEGIPEGFAEPLGRRQATIVPFARELRRRQGEGRLAIPVALLAESLAHLHVNRVFREPSLLAELRLYDFLARVYRSRAALGGKQRFLTRPLPPRGI